MVSFTNATLVLSIGETVEEVTDSGFLGTTPTLTCAQLGEDALIQVTNGLLLSPPGECPGRSLWLLCLGLWVSDGRFSLRSVAT